MVLLVVAVSSPKEKDFHTCEWSRKYRFREIERRSNSIFHSDFEAIFLTVLQLVPDERGVQRIQLQKQNGAVTARRALNHISGVRIMVGIRSFRNAPRQSNTLVFRFCNEIQHWSMGH